MKETEKIYEDLKLETHYDSKGEGYWLIMKNHKSPFFFQKEVLEGFSLLEMKDFVYEMNRNNPEVLIAGAKNGISTYNILESFIETKKIENKKLEKILKDKN